MAFPTALLQRLHSAVNHAVNLPLRMVAREMECVFNELQSENDVGQQSALPCDPKSRQAFLGSLIYLDKN